MQKHQLLEKSIPDSKTKRTILIYNNILNPKKKKQIPYKKEKKRD